MRGNREKRMQTNKKAPMRMCVGCQQMREKRELIRVLRTSDGEFLVDHTGKKNGRGAYLCKDPECLKKAVQNHGLERSFRTSIPRETVETLMQEISRS